MKNKVLTILTAILIFVAGCGEKSSHEFWDSEYGDQNVGYVAFEMYWDEYDDILSPIDDVKITVSGKDGFQKHYDFVSPEEAAGALQQLPEGSYKLLVTVNMDEKHGYALSESQTAADNALPATYVSLKDPTSSPQQAWFGLVTATISNGEISIARFQLKRLMSMITIIINGVPSGASMSATASKVAQSVELTAPQNSTAYHDELALGAFQKSADGALHLDNRTLLPTASGYERTIITLTTAYDGTTQQSIIDVPLMERGRYYVLNLDYNGLTPYIHISGIDINAWQQNWTVDGEILNPDN
jgi:hypothetical protein